MSSRTARLFGFVTILAPVVLAFSLCGCTPAGEEATPKEPAKTPATPSAEALAVLVNADNVDGKADKVVSKCVTCALKMDGKAEHAATVGEYTLNCCSADCKKKLETDLEKALLALKSPPEVKVPEVKTPEVKTPEVKLPENK